MGRLLVVVCLLLSTPVFAQPQEVPSPPPPIEEALPPPVDPNAQAQFDAAFDAMTRGDFTNAALGFRAVLASTGDPELRGAASQLGRLADDFARRGGRLSFSEAPGALASGGAVVAISEDDERDGGRANFVVTTTMASLYSGIVLIDLLDSDSVQAGTAIVMGSTAVGLLGSVYGTSGRTMTGGMADAWSLGLAVGAGNALLMSGPLGLFEADTNASEKVQTFVLGATWGAATAGLLLADQIQPTRAQVSVTGTFGMMGLASTLLSLAIVQPDDLDGDSFLTITAVGLDVGLGAGAAFASKLDWSLSRARYVSLAAFLGAFAGGGTSLLLFADSGDDNNGRLAAGITLAGLWGGFFVGRHLTRDMAPDYRFRRPLGATAMVAPTVIRDAPGAAVVGAF